MINSSSNKNNNFQNTAYNSAAMGAGYGTYRGIIKLSRKVNDKVLINSMIKTLTITPEKNEVVKKSFLKAITASPLNGKVKIINTNEEWLANIIKTSLNNISRKKTTVTPLKIPVNLENPLGRFTAKLFGKDIPSQIKSVISLCRSLQNGFYNGKNNTINANLDKLILPAFHEAGHAMIENFGKLSKFVQRNIRYGKKFAIGIAVASMFIDKKTKEDKPKNAFEKVTSFVKNNAGKLCFAAFIPQMTIEALASHKGLKLAKKFVEAPVLKKMKTGYALAFSTYALLASSVGFGVYAANKVRDYIVSKKEA